MASVLSPVLEHVASVTGLHPLAKAMHTQAAAVLGLEGSLHPSLLLKVKIRFSVRSNAIGAADPRYASEENPAFRGHHRAAKTRIILR